ncbi:hypothetical protein WJX81_008626 [Elliptochloris bilobata]|uniref:PWWP domain-containing protein n=1 Tax=Elliptochloris bilobata TaxID=381761 RepID=A0AAW1RU59_9CHLO
MTAECLRLPDAFHVACPFSGRYVCDCVWGAPTPAATTQRAAEFAHNARVMWQLHQRQEQLFAPPPPPAEVDIALPRLLCARRRVPDPPAGVPSVAEAEAEVRVAEQAAAAAALHAARLAAAAGLDYAVPAGVAVDLSGIQKADMTALEQQARLLARDAAEHGWAPRPSADAVITAKRPAATGTDVAAGPGAGKRRRVERDSAGPAMPASAVAQPDARAPSGAAPKAPQAAARGGGSGGSGGARKAALPSGAAKAPHAAAERGAGVSRAPQAAAEEGAGGGGARSRPPGKQLRLRPRDVRPALLGKRLLLLWPEDGRWWPGTVIALRFKERRATLLYDTGDEELGVDLDALFPEVPNDPALLSLLGCDFNWA